MMPEHCGCILFPRQLAVPDQNFLRNFLRLQLFDLSNQIAVVSTGESDSQNREVGEKDLGSNHYSQPIASMNVADEGERVRSQVRKQFEASNFG